jgi:hypothetical protein
MAEEQEYKPTKSEQKKEDWMNSKWRPMMGWMYMLVCTMDFVGFPILWSLLQAYDHGQVTSQWQPLTLQGAGLFHIAMGAVIGISAYGRTQEKMGGVAGGGMSFPQGAGTTYVPPGQGQVSVSNQPGMGGMGGGFGGSSNGFGSTSGGSAFGSSTSGGFGGSSGSFGSTPVSGGFGASTSSGATAFGSSGSSFGSAPSVSVSGVGAPAPAPGAKPIGPAATAFPPI